MKRTKRILSLLLSLCLVLGLFPSTAFAASGNLPFTDVNTSDWYYNAVQYAYENGIMKGTSSTTFSPDYTTDRGMIVTVLHRMEGTPSVSGTSFTDVAAGKYYADAVAWAEANDIVNGYGDGIFGPEDPITREQMATILYRYADYKGYDTSVAGSLSTFSDANTISTFAVESMTWAIGSGLINGVGNNVLAPQGSATRSQMATILMRFCNEVVPSDGSGNNESKDETYTVTFNLNYGSNGEYSSQVVKAGEKVSEPSAPSRSGYTFSGWYTKTTGGTKFDFGTEITADITLYAHWNSSSSSGPGGGGYVPPSTTYYTVTFYMNDGTNAVHTTATVALGDTVSEPASPERTGYTFEGWYTDSDGTSEYTFTLAMTGNLSLYAKWTEQILPTLESDADNDEVPDVIEYLFGSDPSMDDTDGDGLSDYLEIYVLATDPTKIDSNDDGISDAEDDADGDGLTNIQEVNLGTNLIVADTDHDGLSDYDEVYTYDGLDPLNPDVDGDGILDGDEIRFCLNPLDPSDAALLSSINQVLSEERYDESLLENNVALPTVSGTSDKVLDRNMVLSESADTSLAENRAVVGKGIELDFDGNADLTLSFSIPSDVETAAVMVMTADGGWVLAEEAETTPGTGNTVAAHVTESGTYCVMDLDKLFQLLGIDTSEYYELVSTYGGVESIGISTHSDTEDVNFEGNTYEQTSSNDASGSVVLDDESIAILEGMIPLGIADFSGIPMGQADIAFVIDTTGSMSDEISNVANNIIAFAQRLNSDYNVNVNFALVDYRDIVEDGTDSTRVVKDGASNWFTSTNAFQTAVSRLTVDGGGDTPETAVDALECARRLDFRYAAKKFIVLVTDADYKNDNNYGIASMDEEISLLSRDGIVVSVVTSSSEQSTYRDLYERTGGIFANIYGNFGSELLRLADLIGAEVSEGNWILLNDYQYVALEEPLASGNDCDTDKDGISDWNELKSPTQLNLTVAMKKWLLKQGIPETLIDDYFTAEDGVHITVYPYYSNPVLPDTDFDGIDDGDDSNPRNNHFKGRSIRLKNGKQEVVANVSFTVDYSLFFKDNRTYRKDISVLASLLAADVYEGDDGVYIEVTDGASLTGDHRPEKLLELFGMDDVAYQHIGDGSDNDITDVLVGHRMVTYNGRTQEIIAVSVRGTNGTFEEWSSNFDVGADTAQYTALTGSHPEWTNKDNHKGFDVTANRVKAYVDSYIRENTDPSAGRVILITGHSRGAAIANILGQMYEDDASITSFTYTFAAPTTTTVSDSTAKAYGSIFNIINSDDLIPCLPLDSSHGWGFKRYGVDRSISIKDKYEDHNPFGNKAGTFEDLVGMDYNPNSQMDNVLAAFQKIASNRGALYVFTAADNTYEWLGINHFGFDAAQKDADKFKQGLNSTMKQFCKVEVHSVKDGFGVSKYRAACEQTPAYFMQVLALIAADGEIGTVIGNAVADKYEDARNKFIVCFLAGMTHPHWTESYYLIASNDFLPL